jgi:hypothetical protein
MLTNHQSLDVKMVLANVLQAKSQLADLGWRRARDSNPQGPRGPVDFKFEPPLPSPCRDRSSSLLIMPLRGSLA